MNKYLVSLATILSLVASGSASSGNVVSAASQGPHDMTMKDSAPSSRVMAEIPQGMSATETLELVRQYLLEGKMQKVGELLAMPNSRPELASTEIQATGEEKKYADMDIQTDEPEFVWRSNVGLLEIGIKGELQRTSIDQFLGSKGIDKKSVLEIDVGWGVRVIGAQAFMEFENVKKISLPERLKGIRDEAFKGCKALESIDIPDSVTLTITDSAGRETQTGSCMFEGCSGLKNVRLSKKLGNIAQGMFSECASLQSIDIPEGVTELGASSFYDCKSLKKVVMHSGLVRIGDRAFQKCSVLERVEIPDTVTSLGMYVFSECVGLEFASLSDRLGLISYGTFKDCIKLQKVVMFEALKKIYREAFMNCSALSKLHIPNGVELIEYNAFKNCTSLSEIAIMGSTKLEGSVFENCSSLKKVTMPFVKNGMMSADSFYGCSNLTEITMLATPKPRSNDWYQWVPDIPFINTPIYGFSLPFGDGVFTISVKKHDPSEFAKS